MLPGLAMSMIIQGTTLETIEQAVPMIIEETSQEMKEQLEVVYMTGQLVGTNSELYETRKND